MTQFKILMFLFALNAVGYMVMNANTSAGTAMIPGVKYSQGLNATLDVTQTEEQFNATEMVDAWDTPPEVGIPLFGDIYFVTIEFARKMRFLFDGFAMTLEWCAGFIPATGGHAAFNWIAWVLRAIMSITVGTLIFEIISGRRLLP